MDQSLVLVIFYGKSKQKKYEVSIRIFLNIINDLISYFILFKYEVEVML